MAVLSAHFARANVNAFLPETREDQDERVQEKPGQRPC